MGSAPTVSVIICAYSDDRWERLHEAVGSLQRQTVPPLETVVVIDHNPRLLERALEQLDGAKVVENSRAPGAGGSRNTGVDLARGEIIGFLDDDAAADPRWVDEIQRAHQSGNILGIGGTLEPVWDQGRPSWFPEEFQWVVGCDYRGLPDGIAEVRNVISASMSVDRAAFVAAGGFRRDFGKIGTRSEPEDTELCIRLSSLNPSRPWLYWPSARALHHVPRSRTRFGYFLSRCRDEGTGKAALRGVMPGREALASERSYVLHVLPSGVLKNLRDCVVRREPAKLSRAAVIILGLGVTVLGFCEQLARLRIQRVLGRAERKER